MSDRTAGPVIILPGTLNTIVAVCSGCGEALTLPGRQVRLACPQCGMSGALDASGRNLLPTGWHCPSCSAENPEHVNFCLACGAGLASRCRACEMPVYGAICLHCGAHQARLTHFASLQSGRVAWEPVLRTRAQSDPYPVSESIQSPPAAEPSPDPQAVDQAASQPDPAPRRGRRGRRGWRWGGWWMIVVAYFMLQRVINPALAQLGNLAKNLSLPGLQASGTTTPAIDVPALLAGIWQWLNAPSLSGLTVPSRSDPLYIYLFSATLVGMAALPLLLYLLERIIRRVFQ
jgi:predicted RNA-binding Zn-ribbon protein involved in translation (DUF1610 family)